MKPDYYVQYGFNFSHLSEIIVFKLYKDAIKFFESLDRQMYKTAFIYKQGYYKPDNELHHFALDLVEYKRYYTEIKQNDHILDHMSKGLKL